MKILDQKDSTVSAGKILPRPLSSYIGIGKGVYTSAQEVDMHIRQERSAWEDSAGHQLQ